MRWRILISFILVVTVALASVAFFAQRAATTQLANFFGRGGWLGAEELVIALEDYYAENESWDGVESIWPARSSASAQTGGQGAGPGSGQGNGQGSGQAGGNPGIGGPPMLLRLADVDGTILYGYENGEIGTQVAVEVLETGTRLEVGSALVGYLLPPENSNLPGSGFEEALLQIIQEASLQAAWISGIIALLLALVLSALLIKPIKSLVSGAGELARGNLAHRVSVKQPRELAMLGNAFNHMAESLERAERNRRAMTADIAHELRTPLSVQRAQLEALQDGIYPLAMENIEPVFAQNLLLTRLVNDLRTLALADADVLNLEKRRISPYQLVVDTTARFQAQAAEKRINLQAAGIENLCVEADPERLQQVLHNLLHNGLRHTPENGWMRFELGRDGNEMTLTIRDSGPGIPEESLPFIFDRFYRADKGRDREQGGSGLGLAIARQLVEAHGGSLTAANHPEGGAVFTMRLPLV
ncbi:MAG: two-component sensor histidine kinase [Chloroflexi bacterium HGW-Chloroflexi-10]|nr:MAG: two-component sensor histidine kinase [Chloroflexi bacterium HGW-Chloroflexi-10]